MKRNNNLHERGDTYELLLTHLAPFFMYINIYIYIHVGLTNKTKATAYTNELTFKKSKHGKI